MKKIRNKKSAFMHSLNCRIDNRTLYKLIKYSEERNIKQSVIIRQALQQYLKAFE
ncbi:MULTISPECIES: ribbon-helix-helix domain-containing protein [unclassified Campylobacter]|uniref:ribbon-helix-helix domain-containing protein n=1 Tax=unclassified Campylobacter TaxID=2593542 RepID=UPI001BD9198C|nr:MULTISPECIES: ribbon-helix-helix domain-containing protein [unclassified Campylobacter]MBZ7982113.1 ribbon-helix-helix domain-containing protein [Campylobacter sp. RM12640]MBZ7983528.1 ribbon-helix-helix domain-containing protein [Campylobacter sp. RM12647]MBZ7989687.1 ribbon-helix-helix domain-containing protein [Campylobacter sp. RM12635]MBZ7991745.1 ribbon-helix-helix domain-containing protein [Campylobacter sp. RM9331]MBZ8005201.1 ribbon-helix-helix domain-containing protein [Campylobac